MFICGMTATRRIFVLIFFFDRVLKPSRWQAAVAPPVEALARDYYTGPTRRGQRWSLPARRGVEDGPSSTTHSGLVPWTRRGLSFFFSFLFLCVSRYPVQG